MWDFEHPPLAATLARRYTLHYTQPSLCADELLAARADLGLIPVASLTPDLAIVPGCTIASLNEVRSIQLIVKSPHTLDTVKTIAADTASRSSLAYAEILFRKFLNTHPTFLPASRPIAMLQNADAAILIGDPPSSPSNPANHRIHHRPCVVRLATSGSPAQSPWVAPSGPFARSSRRPHRPQLTRPRNLPRSRSRNIEHSSNVDPRIAIPPHDPPLPHLNIHYTLTPTASAPSNSSPIRLEVDILPPLPRLRFL
jgi:chorismate dehydratase